MRVTLAADQQDWLWGYEPPGAPDRTREYWQRAACLALTNLLGVEEWSDADEERGDVFLPTVQRWVRVRCETPGNPLTLSEEECKPSIYILTYHTDAEDWIEVAAWVTRERFASGSRFISGTQRAMDLEEMEPISTLLQRLEAKATPSSVPSPAASRLREAVSRTAQEQQQRTVNISLPNRIALEEEAKKVKRDWRIYPRLNPQGPCPTGCGDTLDGAIKVCWTCSSAECELCGVRTHAPQLARCSPCNMKESATHASIPPRPDSPKEQPTVSSKSPVRRTAGRRKATTKASV